jgi:hypothetical protein
VQPLLMLSHIAGALVIDSTSLNSMDWSEVGGRKCCLTSGVFSWVPRLSF